MSASIEVERNFVFGPDMPAKIEAVGGRHLWTKTISDTYFDNSDFALISSNFWLRQRNNRWELKHPPDKCTFDDGKSTFVYNEIENEAEIKMLIRDRLLQSDDDNLTLEKMVSGGLLKPFCNLVTRRTSYRLEDDITIVLDFEETLKHYVGEIEIMVHDRALVDEAFSRIDRWCDRLNLDIKSRAVAKVAVYLSRFNSTAYNILVDRKLV